MKQNGPYIIEHAIQTMGFINPHNLYDWLRTTNFSKLAKIKLPGWPNKIGQGSRGFVWQLENKLVLKVTDDAGEAGVAAAIANKDLKGLYKTKGVWQYKEAKALIDGGEEANLDSIYFIVAELLHYDSGRITDLGDALFTPSWVAGWFAQEFASLMGVDNDEVRMSTFWSVDKIRMARDFLELTDQTNDQQLKDDIFNICLGLANLKQMGIKFQDVHSKNIMINSKNEAVLIDIGWSFGAKGEVKTFQ